jgi:hypothetical protein
MYMGQCECVHPAVFMRRRLERNARLGFSSADEYLAWYADEVAPDRRRLSFITGPDPDCDVCHGTGWSSRCLDCYQLGKLDWARPGGRARGLLAPRRDGPERAVDPAVGLECPPKSCPAPGHGHDVGCECRSGAAGADQDQEGSDLAGQDVVPVAEVLRRFPTGRIGRCALVTPDGEWHEDDWRDESEAAEEAWAEEVLMVLKRHRLEVAVVLECHV